MSTAIVFDWGGVLIDDPAPGLMKYCAKELGVNAEQLTDAIKPYFDKFQKGSSEQEFWEQVCHDLNVNIPTSDSLWYDAVKAVFRWRPEVVALAKELKTKGYKIGFLSNTEHGASQFFDQTNTIEFDATVFSCKEGLAKPQREIYQLMCERLQTNPSDTIFIDDKQEYCDGATQAGLVAVRYEHFDQVLKEVTAYLKQ